MSDPGYAAPTTEEEAIARPAGHCENDAAWIEFSERQQYRTKTREDFTKGELSDFALANAVYMASRNDFDLIVYQTAAKERIRWLSIQLAAAQRQIIALRSEREEGEPVAWRWDRVEVEHWREWVSTIYGPKPPEPSEYIRNVEPLYLRKAQGSDHV